jgi:UDP-N-acetylmuramyl pentapeptide phosphotransferase/UDP-N-acetylglucosamine-1-phosphate transferase
MTIYSLGFFSALLALIIALLLTRSFMRPNSRLHILDVPNERSLHSQPTPRTGGIAIVTAILVAGMIAAWYLSSTGERLGWLLASVALVAVTSFIDDRGHLAPGYRLIAHVAAAALLVRGGFVLEIGMLPQWVATLVTVLYIVWMLNLYNFMDGMDGFAGGMAVTGFGTIALFATLARADLLAVLSLATAGAALGFLVFNFPPARIFMGDVGSSTLGLLAAAFSLWGAQDLVFPFWAAVLLFSPFIADATVTLARRVLRRENIWQAHRTHYYQRLVQLGWGHRKTVLWAYSMMAGCALTVVTVANADIAWQLFALAIWTFFYVALFWWIGRREGKLQPAAAHNHNHK